MTAMEGKRWYVVHTQPHAEAKAAANLCRQGFDAYLPRYLKRRRHARRVETVATPLFPRYLFAAIDVTTQAWRAVHSTIGVVHLICAGERPTAVGDGIIAELKRREDERGFVQLERTPQFELGEKVRVLDGVFSACLGLFDGMTDGERVAVLLDLLGRKVRVVLDADFVTAA